MEISMEIFNRHRTQLSHSLGMYIPEGLDLNFHAYCCTIHNSQKMDLV